MSVKFSIACPAFGKFFEVSVCRNHNQSSFSTATRTGTRVGIVRCHVLYGNASQYYVIFRSITRPSHSSVNIPFSDLYIIYRHAYNCINYAAYAIDVFGYAKYGNGSEKFQSPGLKTMSPMSV